MVDDFCFKTKIICFGFCFKCKGAGHIGRDCPKNELSRKVERACHRCGGKDHLIAECKETGHKCHLCGEFGHVKRDCSKKNGEFNQNFPALNGVEVVAKTSTPKQELMSKNKKDLMKAWTSVMRY